MRKDTIIVLILVVLTVLVLLFSNHIRSALGFDRGV